MLRFILLVLSLTLFTDVGSSQSNKRSQPERPKPVVNVQDQSGAPLKISSVQTKWTTPEQKILEIYVLVENVSELKIVSYAWQIETTSGSQNSDKDAINLLKADALIVETPDGHSSIWVDAFREGVRRLFEKLRRANEEGGLPEVERVLQLPFDASGK